MGCDIHCYIEYKPSSDDRWRSFGGRMNPGRNYGMFGFLAGVRTNGPSVAPVRGVPADIGFYANDDAFLFISETESDGYTTKERAKYYVDKCGCRYDPPNTSDPKFVTHPDWHTHSWVTPDEWAEAIRLTKIVDKWPVYEYDAMLAALRSLEQYGQARIVFWFDN